MKALSELQLLEEIARGASGRVVRARHPGYPRDLAVKLYLRASEGSKGRQRFLREAQALVQLSHPNLVRVHSCGEDRGRPYLVMDRVEGHTLQEHLDRSGALPPRRAAELIRELAGALAYAHGEGILHRDLKPANVILDARGRPVLTDFGLAKALDGSQSRLSTTGACMGTPGFWPPEQAAGDREIGEPADVYGLGATLYALLTGEPPFSGDLAEVIAATMQRRPVPPSSHNPDVPPELERIVLRCLAKAPAQRYASAAALEEALGEFLRREPNSSRSPLMLALAIVVTGALAAGYLLGRPRPSPTAGPTPRDTKPIASHTPASPAAPDLALARALAARELTRTAQLLAGRSEALLALHHDAEALRVAEQAAARDPELPAAHVALGEARRRLEDAQGALAALDRALALDPDQGLAHYRRARTLAMRDEHAQALEAYDRAVELRPEIEELFMHRGNARLRAGRPGEAAADYRFALERLPADHQLRPFVAQCLQMAEARAAGGR